MNRRRWTTRLGSGSTREQMERCTAADPQRGNITETKQTFLKDLEYMRRPVILEAVTATGVASAKWE